jgi:hypothetical protein
MAKATLSQYELFENLISNLWAMSLLPEEICVAG